MTDFARAGATRRSHVFGIGVETAFDMPGLEEAPVPSSFPVARVTLGSAEELDRHWQPANPQRLGEERFGGKTPARTIDFDDELGYRLYARHFGLACISPDGADVVCAPPSVAAWRWQRFLVGRVLPWTSLLRGREVIHASAVSMDDQLVAIIAPSGMGKSSLCLRMVLAGARFVTDDVLALSREDGGLRGHPGAGIIAIRDAEKQALGRADLRRLGRTLGTSGKSYVATAREESSQTIGAIYFLEPMRPDAPVIEPGAPAHQLLGSAFIESVTSPRRLEGLLDICAELSRETPLFRLRMDPDQGAQELAQVVLDHAHETISGS